MRMKIVINKEERIHMLATAIIFLSRQADRVILSFSEDKLILQIEKPFSYIELLIKKLACSYVFKGNDPIANEEIPHILVDCNSSTMISILDTFNQKRTQTLEMKMTQDGKYPILDFRGTIQNEKSISYAEFQLPVVYISHVQWSFTNLLDKLHFDYEFQMPKFVKVKKYVDIFKDFKNIRIAANEEELVIYSEVEETKIMSSFMKGRREKDVQNINFYDDFFQKNHYEVQVEWKLMNHFLHSISAMNFRDITLTCSIRHRKMIKLGLTVPLKEMSFVFFLEHIQDDNEYLSYLSDDD